MIKLVVFDLDGTLAELGQGVTAENLALLKKLEATGVRIAVCSGKPTYYLCGFMRQLGLRAPILVGENGAVIQLGVDLPPRDYFVVPYSDAAKRSIRRLADELETVAPGMWYQPNEVGLSPFPRNDAEFESVTACIERLRPALQDVIIYRHCDCYDVMPEGVTKKSGLTRLGALLGIAAEETVCVGDGVNDYPMFEYAGLSLGIHLAKPELADHNFPSITEALIFLLDRLAV